MLYLKVKSLKDLDLKIGNVVELDGKFALITDILKETERFVYMWILIGLKKQLCNISDKEEQGNFSLLIKRGFK